MSKQVQDLKSLTESELIDLALSCGPEQQELRQQALMEHSERTRNAPGTVTTKGDDIAALAAKVSQLRNS